jgi:hypothetical protein
LPESFAAAAKLILPGLSVRRARVLFDGVFRSGSDGIEGNNGSLQKESNE